MKKASHHCYIGRVLLKFAIGRAGLIKSLNIYFNISETKNIVIICCKQKQYRKLNDGCLYSRIVQQICERIVGLMIQARIMVHM